MPHIIPITVRELQQVERLKLMDVPISALKDLINIKYFEPQTGFRLFKLFGKDILPYIPFKSFVARANEEQLQFYLVPDQLGTVDEEVLVIMARQCNTDELIDALLNRADVTDAVFLTLLTKPHLAEQQFLTILQRSQNNEVRHRVYNHPTSNKTVRDAMKDSLSSEIILPFLKGSTPIADDELLGLLLHHNDSILLGILAHKKTDRSLIMAVINHSSFSPHAVQKLLEQEEIDNLLARPEMTRAVASSLFRKPQYSGIIDTWDWLTEAQLIRVISQSTDFDNVMRGLTHPNLSERARKKLVC